MIGLSKGTEVGLTGARGVLEDLKSFLFLATKALASLGIRASLCRNVASAQYG